MRPNNPSSTVKRSVLAMSMRFEYGPIPTAVGMGVGAIFGTRIGTTASHQAAESRRI